MNKKQKKMMTRIIIAAVLLVVLHFIPITGIPRFICYLAIYLEIGYDILKKAFKGIKNGQVFDENFLMAVATIGAWAVGSFDEAVGVMLFYRIGEFFEEKAVERSRGQIMDAVDMRPETVNRIHGDDIET